MQTLILTFVVFALAILGLSIGAIFGRNKLKGSCNDNCTCSIDKPESFNDETGMCDAPCETCPNKDRED